MTQPALIPADANVALTHTGRAARRAPHPMADYDTRHWRGVRATYCRDCRAPILTGLDADLCAFPAQVDVTQLNALGEAMAQLDGRATYAFTSYGVAKLTRRTASAIARYPAGAPGSLAPQILAEHRCGHRTPQPLTAEPIATRTTTSDKPPF